MGRQGGALKRQADAELNACVARILPSAEGARWPVAGAGFLVGDGHLITCAHVVEAALGLTTSASGRPEQDVLVDFHLASAGAGPDTARVIERGWFPAASIGQRTGDIAILKLDKTPPSHARPARVRRPKSLLEEEFFVIGFANPDGQSAVGELQGNVGGWVQMSADKPTGKRIQRGFSGAPVWGKAAEGVIGMVVVEDTAKEDRTAYMLPLDELARAFRPLETQLRVPQRRRNARRVRTQQAAPRRGPLGRFVGTRRSTSLLKDRVEWRMWLGGELTDGRARLVGVWGRPGVGKTALAGWVVDELERGRNPAGGAARVSGVVSLDAREQVTLTRLIHLCNEMLGENSLGYLLEHDEMSGDERAQRLLEHLDEGPYILLFDNAELLLDECTDDLRDKELAAFFKRAVLGTANVRCLVTTRRRINTPDDFMEFEIWEKLTEALPKSDAVATLRDFDPGGGLGLRDASLEQLERGVELVHGIPQGLRLLARTLKAGRQRGVTLEDLLAREYASDDIRDELVVDGLRSLQPDPARVVDALAVLGRPVPAVAVDKVLEPFAPGLAAEEVIGELADALVVDVHREPGHALRYALHPLDAEHALERVGRSRDYSRHVLEHEAAEYYQSTRRPVLASIVDAEPQFAEFDHRANAGETERAVAILEEIDGATLAERGQAQRVLDMCQRVYGTVDDERLRATLEYTLGHVHMVLGPFEGARRHFGEALAMAQARRDGCLERQSLACLGELLRKRGHLEDALDYLRAALEKYGPEEVSEKGVWGSARLGRSSVLIELSLASSYAGDVAGGLEYGDEILRSAVKGSEQEAWAHDALALAQLILGDLGAATHHSERSLELYERLEWPERVGYLSNVVGLCRLDHPSSALEPLERARDLGRSTFSLRVEALASYNLAHVKRVLHDFPAAKTSARRAEELFGELGSDDLDAARELSETIAALTTGARETAVQGMLRCASASARNGDLYPAVRLAREARGLARGAGERALEREATRIHDELDARINRPVSAGEAAMANAPPHDRATRAGRDV